MVHQLFWRYRSSYQIVISFDSRFQISSVKCTKKFNNEQHFSTQYDRMMAKMKTRRTATGLLISVEAALPCSEVGGLSVTRTTTTTVNDSFRPLGLSRESRPNFLQTPDRGSLSLARTPRRHFRGVDHDVTARRNKRLEHLTAQKISFFGVEKLNLYLLVVGSAPCQPDTPILSNSTVTGVSCKQHGTRRLIRILFSC